MIIPSMTEPEFIQEVKNDYLNAFRYSDHKDQPFRRLVVRAKRFPVRAVFEYTSPRKNRWIMFFEARNKTEHGDMSRICFVCYFNTPHGFYAVMPTFTNGVWHLVIFPPHFFSRYGSRCWVKKTGIPLMVDYFKRNCSYVYEVADVALDANTLRREVYGSTADGVALGLISEHNNVLFKTFITYDMCKGTQVERFAKNEAIRREIHEQ